MRKGVSLAIFGFMTLAVAVAAIVWVQYNTYGGIRGKASSSEDFSILRVNEEYMKGMAFLERALAVGSAGAMSEVSAAGGVCDGDASEVFWVCGGEGSVPSEDGILECIETETKDYFNSQADAITDTESSIMVRAKKATNISVEADYSGKLKVIAYGTSVVAGNLNAYLESGSEAIEWSTDDGRLISDYRTIKRWAEQQIALGEVVGAISDDDVLPGSVTDAKCGCGKLACPMPSESFQDVFPCFGDRVSSAARNAVEQAVYELENGDEFFGGSVSCSVDIECVGVGEPVFLDVDHRRYGSDECCEDECLGGCENEDETDYTDRICSDEAGVRVCERPACAAGLSETDDEDYDDEYYSYGDECGTCCEVSFRVGYVADVTFTVSCTDERGVEPVVWTAKFFVSAMSS